MTSDNSLYWVCLETETDTSHQELYFPPDTPTGNVNHLKKYNLLRKRHARQWERLKIQQANEFGEYQRKFSIEYQDDLFIKPTATACELICGSDYLNTHNESISEVLSNITLIIAENDKQKELKPKNDKSDRRRSEYLGILAKKYSTGFETIADSHESQVMQLKQIQRQDYQSLPRELWDPIIIWSLKSRKSSTSPPVNSHSDRKRRHLDDESDRAKKNRKEDRSKSESSRRKEYSSSRSEKASSRNERSSRDEYERSSSSLRNEKNERSSSSKNEKNKQSSSSRNEKLPSIERLSSSGKEKLISTERLSSSPSSLSPRMEKKFNDNRSKQTFTFPTSAAKKSGIDSRLPNINVGIPTNTRPPAIGIGVPTNTRAPTISIGVPTNTRLLTVGTSKKTSKQTKQRSSGALFSHNALQNTKVQTLMDRGSLLVQNKPNRVIIRGQNGTSTTYGNPKDYDDAINSSNTRSDNPVHKRRVRGMDYLFYKTESGHVVTIGPVSEIQPLIHKFFLSM